MLSHQVPLKSVHQLREHVNLSVKDVPISLEMLSKFDAPIIASTVKLWLLEINPPLGTWEGWDDIRKLYPQGKFFLMASFRCIVHILFQWALRGLPAESKIHTSTN